MRETSPIISSADSDILSRHAIADYLRACGHTIFEAANLKEAQSVIERL